MAAMSTFHENILKYNVTVLRQVRSWPFLRASFHVFYVSLDERERQGKKLSKSLLKLLVCEAFSY
jgi:hypothetical protein